ncbi:23S rRNA (pseudouridine(1915)-N(3))-methyltransferase RlmH, partial [Campylobacter jejuni]|nr:23S rRNA (pseudouridine(1915)-N(3))-methyltransferase RlmH [Campylobacter jejuni]
KGFCIVLDERGKELTSVEFAKLIADKNNLNFFIGGAYGLRDEFNQRLEFRLSLSKLTLAHQFVKILLLEQIYRAFCINSNHPYHK